MGKDDDADKQIARKSNGSSPKNAIPRGNEEGVKCGTNKQTSQLGNYHFQTQHILIADPNFTLFNLISLPILHSTSQSALQQNKMPSVISPRPSHSASEIDFIPDDGLYYDHSHASHSSKGSSAPDNIKELKQQQQQQRWSDPDDEV